MAKKKPAAAPSPDEIAETAQAVVDKKLKITVTPKYFVIAETKALAEAIALAEWSWTKKGTGWIDADGNAVAYLSDSAALMAQVSKGSIRLYEGYRWYAVIPSHHLEALKKTGAVEVVKADSKPVIA